MLVPPWLEPLLSTTFFTICQSHISLPRNECNMFCIDCSHRSAFCFYCKSIWHQHHRVIQIRRSSYHDVVRVSEIDKVLDISGVQTYVINSAKVIFLNERPQPKTNYGGKSSSHLCRICRRSLLDPFCFCSLGCKLVGIKKNKERNKKLGSTGKRGEEERRTLGPSKEDDEFGEGNEISGKQRDRLPPLQQAYSNSRRRKGIHQRAPLGP
ncbi:protein RGF1 INDUCIBLE TRANSCRIPTION FACTOR 1 [Prosopis cineraria]|uniref:protein RGF1 INDUCIBLE TRANSCRIPTION FACTOR 1 n=1 Tax=Prosopis cineraria TaxID=364024 RepID=UPI00240F93E0|nr:protein RGF1 INDUCIBLE TRANSCRIPTION FACTOR 1 [Prosopis cineraria]